tara:strand:+ start:470 stop:640 length:171 start_codon:yes stop_codon:yes gene_type:complete
MTVLAANETYSIHYRKGVLTIYDKRMNNHLPLTLKGEEAEEFALELLAGDLNELCK